jgi:hypothetical protein
MEAQGTVIYEPFMRALKAFTVTEVLKGGPRSGEATLAVGDEILVAGPDDNVLLVEHLSEELFRVHGMEFYESPVVGFFESSVTEYEAEDSLVLFLSSGVRRLAEDEALPGGWKKGGGGIPW